MRFIVNNKIYDTDKAELLAEGIYEVREPSIFKGFDTVCKCKSKLYKTQKGTYYFVYEYKLSHCIELVTEDEAKSWLMHADYSKYAELFGELEEG